MALIDEIKTAEVLGVQPSTLAAWRVRGSDLPYVKVGRAVRYDEEDIAEWIASRKVRSTSESFDAVHEAPRTASVTAPSNSYRSTSDDELEEHALPVKGQYDGTR